MAAPLLLPLRLSATSPPFSLSVRLFGNIFAEELIIGSLNSISSPFWRSIPVMFLALLLSTIQAFIFIHHAYDVYISSAVEEIHENPTAAFTVNSRDKNLKSPWRQLKRNCCGRASVKNERRI